MTVRTTTLQNGIVVLTDDMPQVETAAIGVWIKAGSRSERVDEHGISHLLEHMAFKGTATRSARDIAEAVEDVGGELNAATSVEHTGYFARMLKEDVELATDILADILQNSLFDPEELTREKKVIIQEIGSVRDDPEDQVFDLFQEAAFPDQAIGRTILGTTKSVKSFNPQAIRDYLDRNYVAPQMVICAAGNIDHQQLVDMSAGRFHRFKAEKAPSFEAARYVGGDQRLIRDHEQAHFVLGLEGRAYNSEGYYAAQILASILGGGMSSRLFQEVREKRGLCYAIDAFHWAFEDSGILGIAAATGEDELSQLIPVVLDELRRAADTITADEVVRVRNRIRAGIVMSLESPSARASQLARQQLLWGRPVPISETMERISRIDADRVRQIAMEMFSIGRVTLAGIGPVSRLPDAATIGMQLRA